MRKIIKIVTFYDDGTFTESVPEVKPVDHGYPIWPCPMPPPSPSPSWYGNCPQCGLKLEGVMGYVCSNPKCPTGLGGAWCSTESNT